MEDQKKEQQQQQPRRRICTCLPTVEDENNQLEALLSMIRKERKNNTLMVISIRPTSPLDPSQYKWKKKKKNYFILDSIKRFTGLRQM